MLDAGDGNLVDWQASVARTAKPRSTAQRFLLLRQYAKRVTAGLDHHLRLTHRLGYGPSA
jgi:hypothetical protein